MKTLGNFEKIISASDDIPLGVHLKLAQKRDEAIQHLGDASSDGCRIDHFYRLAAHCRGEKVELVELGFADDGCIVLQRRRRRWWGRSFGDAGRSALSGLCGRLNGIRCHRASMR